MARRQHNNSISLFPFLAVLVCAMGALILLLLVMTRKIRQDQRVETVAVVADSGSNADLDLSGEIADVEAKIRALQTGLASMQSEEQSITSDIAERRQQIASLESELADLNEKLQLAGETGQPPVAQSLSAVRQLKAKEAALLRQLKAAEKQLFEKQQQLLNAEDASKEADLVLQEKHSDLISLRNQVKEAEARQRTSTGTETLLEFSNATGTTRTPIVIDVSERGFEILPNGIQITPADMEGFPVRDNPLLAAVLTVHRMRTKNSVTAEPYVLLLVRPDGALAFYGAQRVLIESGIHYGYELLDPDQKLVVGDVDESEVPAVRASIAEALRRRENLYAKLMAIAQQKSGTSGSNGQPQKDSSDRRLSVRPDGRVVMDEGAERRPLDGRFYAGGVAPPASHFANRPAGGYGGLDRDRMTAADAEKLADEFAARYAKQQEVARSAAASAPPSESLSRGAGSGSEFAPSKSEQKSAEALVGGDSKSASSPAVGGSGTAESFRAESRTAARTTNTNTGELLSNQSRSSVRNTSVDSIFAGTETLDATRASSEPSEMLTEAADENYSALSSLMAQDDSKRTAKTGTPGAASQSKSSGAPDSLLLPSPSNDSPSTGIPDLSRIDPDLLRRLAAAKRQSSSLSTPIGIIVFLDEHHMTVAQQSAVEVSSESLDAALATLLTGINTEVEDQKSSRNEAVMPIVKFIVSPGGEKWRIPLSHSLKSTGIRSATVYELTPYITTSDNTGRARVDDVSPE